MDIPFFSNQPVLKKSFFAGFLIIFILSFVIFFGFHDPSGIVTFFFGITIAIAYFILVARDSQKYPTWLYQLLESALILSISFVGFVYYYLSPEIPITQPILWISYAITLVAIIHAVRTIIAYKNEKQMTKNPGKIILVFFLLAIFFVGIISLANAQTVTEKISVTDAYNLSYHLNKGERYLYEIQSVEGEQKIPSYVKMHITDDSNHTISLDSVSSVSTSGITVEKKNSLKMTNGGMVIESTSDTPFFPEIQRDLPNTMAFPEKSGGNPWRTAVNRQGNYSSQGNNVIFSVSGESTNDYIGRKEVLVKAGNFDCVGIHSEINFSMNESINTINGTVFTITSVHASGENWIDEKKGFLVSSSYVIDKRYNIDLTEVYHELGFKTLKREIPTKLTQTIELTQNN